jgi:hydrogenase maturation protease
VTVLVAGLGNVFLGDDGFGVEVIAQLRRRGQRPGVELGDFGVAGVDLAYALMDGGYDAAVLVDALPHGRAPGTVSVIEPDLEQIAGDVMVEGHAMDPLAVLRLVRALGGAAPAIRIVGCEPADLGPEEGRMGLSPAVQAAVEPAAAAIEELLAALAPKVEGG